MKLRERLGEYLTLNRALAAAGRVDEAARAEATRELRLSKQKRLAAEQLLVDGSRAEAVPLAAASAQLACSAVDRLGDARPDDLTRAAAELGELSAKLADAPALDADVTAGQLSAARDVLVAGYTLERIAAPALLDARALTRLRVVHWGHVAACALFLFLAARFAREIFFGPKAQASSEQSALYGAERAVDGDPETEWAAKDADHPWLELSWPLSRRVRTIKILNGHGSYNHGSSGVLVELYQDARMVHGVSGTFATTPPDVFVMLDGGGVRCNRVRISPVATAGRLPSVAEVVIE